jgi:UPF0755 protein
VSGRRALTLAAALALAAAGLTGAAAWATWRGFLDTAVAPSGGRPVTVPVRTGATAREVSQQLAREGVVSSARLFEWFLRFEGAEAAVQAGEHRFERALRPAEVLEELRVAQASDLEVTLLEGWTRMQVVAALAAAGVADGAALDAAFADPAPVRDFDPAARDLEGYLFPDTYRFRPGTAPREVAALLVANFRRRFAEPYAAAVRGSGRPLHEVVTLASIVERETGGASERPQVAGVFLDRLARGMPLQSDPTVIYARERAGTWDGNLTRADLERDDPYNTYTRGGLPPGPIGSPGLAALRAVLEPERTGALYFVSRGDGTHQFSRTLAEHNRAVRRYQLRGRAR